MTYYQNTHEKYHHYEMAQQSIQTSTKTHQGSQQL